MRGIPGGNRVCKFSEKMKDTPPEILKIQRDIIHVKTDRERAMLGFEMIENTRQIVKNSLKIENPGFSEREIIAELFERYYSEEFSEEEIEIIKQGIRNFAGGS